MTDTSFKDYSELYKWASEGKPILHDGSTFKALSQGGYNLHFACNFNVYSNTNVSLIGQTNFTLWPHIIFNHEVIITT